MGAIMTGRPFVVGNNACSVLALNAVPEHERPAIHAHLTPESGRVYRSLLLGTIRIDATKVTVPVFVRRRRPRPHHLQTPPDQHRPPLPRRAPHLPRPRTLAPPRTRLGNTRPRHPHVARVTPPRHSRSFPIVGSPVPAPPSSPLSCPVSLSDRSAGGTGRRPVGD